MGGFRHFLCSQRGSHADDEDAKRMPEDLPSYRDVVSLEPDILATMETCLDSLSDSLRKLSLDIHDHPEQGWDTIRTHDKCVEYMKACNGWQVTPHAYGLKAGWEAKFSHGRGGRTIGFNSEMDAQPNGHSCGHNLIAIGGIGAAIATAEALVKHDVSGTVILLGTPFEEGGGGKLIMLKEGAYKPMDACLMLHPGPKEYAGFGPMPAAASCEIEYHGKSAHAAGAPWEGINALDAAVAAYNSVAMLRQQCKPAQRVHATIKMHENAPINIIPDYAKATIGFRCSTHAELDDLRKKIINIAEAARLATGATMKVNWLFDFKDVRYNSALQEEYTRYMHERQKTDIVPNAPSCGSTDFGDVTYALPGLHPIVAIETNGLGGNHSENFAKAARTMSAHRDTIKGTKGIAATALRFLTDDTFAQSVRSTFHKD